MFLVVATSNVITWPVFWRSATSQFSFKAKCEKLTGSQIVVNRFSITKVAKNESIGESCKEWKHWGTLTKNESTGESLRRMKAHRRVYEEWKHWDGSGGLSPQFSSHESDDWSNSVTYKTKTVEVFRLKISQKRAATKASHRWKHVSF